MSSKLYFAYGSNLWLDQMKSRCKTSTPYITATLDNYTLTFKANKRGRGVADIVKNDGSKVFGALYYVKDEDIKALDRFEGHPNTYVRSEVTVTSLNGEQVNAITYIMKPEFNQKVPQDDYLQRIIKGYEDWELPVSELLKCVNNVCTGN